MAEHTKDKMEKTLCRFILENILDENVSILPDTNFKDVGIDSYSIIEIILFIERKFGIIIPDDQLNPDNLKSVQSLAICAKSLQKS